jgi:predicted outer membrane repeat protein
MFSANSAGDDGGGMYNWDKSNPALTNCTFSGNKAIGSYGYGGGIYNANNSSSQILTNCTFRQNLAGGGGGIFSGNNPIWLDLGLINLTNCKFSNNSAEEGGGIYYYWSNPTVSSCTFTGNSAEWGGGIYCYMSNVNLMTCTVVGNSGANGNALACDSYQQNYPSNFQITNCILWDGDGEIFNNDTSTISIMYSDIQGGWPGEGNIDADPCFVDPGYWDANGVWIEGDYHLLPGSPCIDAGDPNYVDEPNETDLDGKPRVIDCQIDMGAYEYGQFVPAEVKIVPRTINLASEGKWITCYIWLPEEYDVSDIYPNSVLFECEIEVEFLQVDEEEQIAVARFSRSEVQEILNVGDVELTISVHLMDGTAFEGRDVIKVTDKGRGK